MRMDLLRVSRSGVGVGVVSVSVSVVASDRTAHAEPPPAQYLGQKLVPSTAKLDGTVIRGLSAISYDTAHQLYYVISDDTIPVQRRTVLYSANTTVRQRY